MSDQISLMPMFDESKHVNYLLNGMPAICTEGGECLGNVFKFYEKEKKMSVEIEIAAYGGSMMKNDFGEWHDWRRESPTRDMEGQTMLVSNGESYALCDWCEGGCWADKPFSGFRYNDEIEYWAELPDIPRR